MGFAFSHRRKLMKGSSVIKLGLVFSFSVRLSLGVEKQKTSHRRLSWTSYKRNKKSFIAIPRWNLWSKKKMSFSAHFPSAHRISLSMAEWKTERRLLWRCEWNKNVNKYKFMHDYRIINANLWRYLCSARCARHVPEGNVVMCDKKGENWTLRRKM